MEGNAMALDMAKMGALVSVIARDLDDIPDLPDYKVPKPGVYKLLVQKVEQREINKKTALVVEYSVVDIIQVNETTDENDPNVIPGNMFSEAFWFNDQERIENTLSVLKKKYSGLAEACGTKNLLDILNKMEGMQVRAIVTNRLDPDGKQDEHGKVRIYASTREMVPAV
ncbi:MAG TPA: hypothetical protein VF974_01550 [Patescibacteria group bacterium]